MEWEGGLREIASGVHAYIDPEGTWFKNNSVFITGDYTVMVDTQASEARLRKVLGLASEAGIERPRVVINTHHHGDHSWTNHLVEGALVLCHEEARRIIESMLAFDPAIYKAFFPQLDFTGAKYTRPHLSISGTAALTVPGGPKVRIEYAGHAHTPGDLYLVVEDHNVVIAGDIIFYGVAPLAVDANIKGWIRALERLEELEAEAYIPGHGPPINAKHLKEVRDYLALVLEAARRAIEREETPLEAALKTNLGRFAEWRDRERIVANIERAMLELKGVDPKKPLPNIA